MSEPRTRRTARIVSVVAASVISLACGTNYAYSAWAPEFGDKLKLSSTQVNLIGNLGNLGMYTAGIPIGMLVDSRGPRPGVVLGALAQGIGYYSIYRSFESGPENVSVPWLCVFAYLTGVGGCAAFAGAVKTSALNWPDSRGTATAFPLSAFGLSAFFFASLSHFAFPDNTADLLLLLTIATFTMIVVGGIFLRVIPHTQNFFPLEGNGSNSSTLLKRTKSEEGRHQTRELGTQQDSNSPSDVRSTADASFNNEPEDSRPGETETSSLLSKSTGPGDVPETIIEVKEDDSRKIDIRGFDLLRHTKFYMLWIMLGLMTGIGLMTINNIGSSTRAIWHHYDDSLPPSLLQQYQLSHVSLLSFMSFTGRLLSGVGSDLIVKRLNMSRFWCLFLSSTLFLLAQLFGFTIATPHALALVSGLTGLAYGFLFGVYPTLVVETFGIAGLSQNWGTMTLAPIPFGNAFNLVYGRIYDEQSVIGGDGARDCRAGLECYRGAYLVTMVASVVGVGMSVWSIRHDYVGRAREKRDRVRDGELTREA